MKVGNPLILSDTVLIREDTGPIYFDSSRLQSPNREALVVTEARFYAAYPVGITAIGLSGAHLGYEARISLNVGPYIMCEKVPIWGLEPSRDAYMENPGYMLSCFRWRFMRPLFIPPGTGFSAAITRSLVPNVLSTFIDTACPISCTFVARVVEGDYPRSMVVPYAISWAPVPVEPAVTTVDRMAGIDLQNNLDKPVELKYAIGRMARIRNLNNASPGPMAVTLDVMGAAAYAATGLSALCQFQFDNEVVAPTGTQFNAIFDYARRCLPLANVELRPGQRPLFRMSAQTGNVASAPPIYRYWAPNVTLVGYRKEATP